MVFIGYLGAQVSVAVHILQFRSTHQYYRTAKYEPKRTIGDEDRAGYVFVDINSGCVQVHPNRNLAHLPRSGLAGRD